MLKIFSLSGENTTVDYQFPRLLLLLNVQRETNVGEIQSYFRRHDLMCWETKGGVPLADSKQLDYDRGCLIC